MSTVNRALRPYRPVDVQAVDTSESGGGVAISWKNRNRLNPVIVKQTATTETLEVGQTTTVRIYGELDTLIHTETGLTGTTFVYDDLVEIADAGALQESLRIEAFAERDSLESLYSSTARVFRIGTVVVGSLRVTVGGQQVIASSS